MKLKFLMAALLAGSVSISCQPPPSAENAVTASAPAAARTDARGGAWEGAPRDLTQDEAAGGHVLRRHIGRSDNQLRDRLDHERNISAASTYTDRSTAENVIGAAIAHSQDRIQRWLSHPGGHPNLVLDYDASQPIGRTINRGDSMARPCSHAVVVLKYAAPSFYVLTSYPECRS